MRPYQVRAKEGQRRSFSRLCQDTLPSSWRLRSWASCCLCPLRMVYTNGLSVSIVTSESSTLFPRALRPLLLVSGHERPLPSSCVMVMVLCYGCKHDDGDATDCAVQLTAMSDSRSRKKRFVSSLPRPRSLAFAHSLPLSVSVSQCGGGRGRRRGAQHSLRKRPRTRARAITYGITLQRPSSLARLLHVRCGHYMLGPEGACDLLFTTFPAFPPCFLRLQCLPYNQGFANCRKGAIRP